MNGTKSTKTLKTPQRIYVLVDDGGIAGEAYNSKKLAKASAASFERVITFDLVERKPRTKSAPKRTAKPTRTRTARVETKGTTSALTN